MFKTKDISVVIPTYNRSVDLEKSLRKLKLFAPKILEIIVVDQSEGKESFNVCKQLNIKNLKYVHSNVPSITRARNLGVKKSSSNSKIICFLDDDAEVGRNYFLEIVRVFNKYKNCVGVAVYQKPDKINNFENFVKKIFFLGNFGNSAKIISAYGNTYPFALNKVINVEWFSGVNMCYKKEVFKTLKFDENLKGYTVAEDIDFSYNIHNKFFNGLYLTPHASILHRYSREGRYPTRKMSYINQIDHFYFFFKNLNTSLKNRIIFVWSLIGISLLRVLNFLFLPTKTNFYKLKFYFESLFYCLRNIEKIKNGKLRDFDIQD